MKNILCVLSLFVTSVISFAQTAVICPIDTHDFSADEDEILSPAQQKACIPTYLKHKKMVKRIGINNYEGDFDDSTMPVSIKVPLMDTVQKHDYTWKMQWDQIEMKYEDPSFYMPSAYTSFFFSKAPKEQFDFKRWLKGQQGIAQGILYQEPNGVIFYDKTGQLMGVHYLYDDKLKLHAIAKVTAWRGYDREKRLEKVVQNYAILKTLGNVNTMGDVIHTDLLKLKPQQYMKKFTYKFDVNEARIKIADVFQELLKPDNFLKKSGRNLELGVKGSYGGSWTGYLKISSSNESIDSLKQALKDVELSKEPDVAYNPINKVVYEDEQAIIFQNSNVSNDRYTYFFIEDNGIVYQFDYHPDHEHDQLRNHLDIIQLLRSIKPPNHPYSQKMLNYRKQKYDSVYTYSLDNKTYIKLIQGNIYKQKQGLIDIEGNEIYPITEGASINIIGNYSFSVRQEEGEKSRYTLYNTKGEIILDDFSGSAFKYDAAGEILQICEDWSKEKCQPFNVKLKQWHLPSETQ